MKSITLALAFVALVGCGKKQDAGAPAAAAEPPAAKPADPAPAAPAAPAPTPAAAAAAATATCETAAAASKVNDAGDYKRDGVTAFADEIEAMSVKHCHADGWKPELVQCLADARSGADGEKCAAMMTPEQMTAMKPDVGAIMAKGTPPAAAPAPAAADGSAATP